MSSSININLLNKSIDDSLTQQIEKPLKDELPLQGLTRGNLDYLSPHSHPSF